MTVKHLALSCFLCFFIHTAQAQVCNCDPEDSPSGEWATITAPSGLTLRAQPNKSSTRLAAIPYGEEVRVCRLTNVSETIEGKDGRWRKVAWADKTGYVFDGFLEIGLTRQVQMVIPDAGVDSGWFTMELDPTKEWNAIIDTRPVQNSRRDFEYTHYYSQKLAIGQKLLNWDLNQEKTLQNGILNLNEAPFAIVSGFDPIDKTTNQILQPFRLLPGEIKRYSTWDAEKKIRHEYILVVYGTPVPNPDFMENYHKGPLTKIKDYQLVVFSREEAFTTPKTVSPWTRQTLVSGDLGRPGDTDTWEMDAPRIYFAGDLDGDSQLDLILAYYGGVGSSFHLFLSSKKLPGFIMRFVAQWNDSGC
jgi:hypothetical protein